jgi:hypothetical protein
MAKRRAVGVANGALQGFLIALSVDSRLRTRFSEASDAKRRELLASEFKIGDRTINALLSTEPGRVKARLRFSDQQGTQSSTPQAARKAGARKRKR